MIATKCWSIGACARTRVYTLVDANDNSRNIEIDTLYRKKEDSNGKDKTTT